LGTGRQKDQNRRRKVLHAQSLWIETLEIVKVFKLSIYTIKKNRVLVLFVPRSFKNYVKTEMQFLRRMIFPKVYWSLISSRFSVSQYDRANSYLLWFLFLHSTLTAIRRIPNTTTLRWFSVDIIYEFILIINLFLAYHRCLNSHHIHNKKFCYIF
jgi:hypothetical protein